jgi:hypothetical protein
MKKYLINLTIWVDDSIVAEVPDIPQEVCNVLTDDLIAMKAEAMYQDPDTLEVTVGRSGAI